MITFLGDVALISSNLKSEYKPQHPYVINCEYVIGNKDALTPVLDKINLCSEMSNYEEIFGCNPIAASVINNHTYDYGEQGFESTIGTLRNKDIGVVEQAPFYLNDNVCLLAYMDLGEGSGFSTDYDRIENEISEIRRDNVAVKIVVLMHWGIENHPSISNRQQEVGHWLIDHGVNLVIGHHPHCIQPIEQYKGKYICYSLGNGLFGNIDQPSHYDEKGVAKRTYRFKWQRWNRKSLAIHYDEESDTISADELYQKKDTLLCKKSNVELKKFSGLKRKNIVYAIRKYSLFFVSNFFVDGKLFDIAALKHELRRKS